MSRTRSPRKRRNEKVRWKAMTEIARLLRHQRARRGDARAHGGRRKRRETETGSSRVVSHLNEFHTRCRPRSGPRLRLSSAIHFPSHSCPPKIKKNSRARRAQPRHGLEFRESDPYRDGRRVSVMEGPVGASSGRRALHVPHDPMRSRDASPSSVIGPSASVLGTLPNASPGKWRPAG